ncbi:1-acylglycerol-3-phosphate O-acyltransferase [Blochmannia endosymbiont of Colobopsis nipponica]|uniref:1-acylglycerol-3-phosphate O-acyltransferase n=1 Tax=Blochmannia endosymbiont of Colobopsis nipponica TaxID=2681987 RepID=UPI00177AB367|nr:1-acylglycerol-3-phosphate O-acyltransferase [Blochmannia endosymbiont of Colobopsis nipponica]QOI10786.1 1-acylglycerol-3-phosphate O-acyltransferase [Blochmannia endosymbiont of Colobopsis nipponica]
MLAVIRILLISILSVFICIFGSVYCLLSPRNPAHAAILSRFFSRMAPVFGIQIELRQPLRKQLAKNYIYVSNHQNNYDLILLTYVVKPRTITVGKRSLLWIPLFGLLYWLTGNLFIDRNNILGSHNAIVKLASRVKREDISLWIFPEGTRSRGRGLLPFKTSVFYAAIFAGVPIVPVCVSNTVGKIKLNRLYNGVVLIEILPPLETVSYNIKQVRMFTEYCYNLMKTKIYELNTEIAARDLSNKSD